MYAKKSRNGVDNVLLLSDFSFDKKKVITKAIAEK
jgi:hypothetical protein